MSRRIVAVVLLAALPALVSCRKKTPRPVPPPAKIPVHEPVKPPPPPLLEAPPRIAVIPPETGAVELAATPALPPPPVAKKSPPPAAPRAATAEPAPTSAAPQLRPMLTPAQRQELERVVGERLRRAQGVLALARGRSLSGDQAELANQVRTFIRQAEEARETDLLRANNFAERAEVLAQDLAQRLR